MSIEDVAPIFERINSTGTRLTIVDLMRAATWSQDFDLIDAIDDVRAVLSEKGFADLDRKVILRTMSAAAGGGFSVDSIGSLRKFGSEKLKKAALEAEEAYRLAVDFLSTQIKIPSVAILPYANQIVVLADLFRKLPKPSAEQYKEIHKWFWQTAASGYFSGWNTGMMASDKQAVIKFADGIAPNINVPSAVRPPVGIWSSRQFRGNGAHAKLIGILLAYHNPVDLLTGQVIEVSRALAWTNAKEYHHFFPKDFLKRKKVDSSKINCLANIIMLSSSSNKIISNKSPSEYLPEVAKAAGADLEKWLDSNLITIEAYEAALNDDFELFLKLRANIFDKAVNELAHW
ncbi:MAG: hypothetical protein OEV42_14050 [Deltaproteobacteria bacterium]|nr:hypothetical protein [Deltaproteobacteria bacterium]